MRTFAHKPKENQQTTSAKSTIPGRARFGQGREANSILHLQRTIGNQAVQRLLEANTMNVQGDSTSEIVRFGHDFSRIPVHVSAQGHVRPTLKASASGSGHASPMEQPAREDLQAGREEDLTNLPPEEKEITTDVGVAAEILAGSRSGRQTAFKAVELPWNTSRNHVRGQARQTVTTVIRPRQEPQTFATAPSPLGHLDKAAHSAVAPGGTPAVNNSAASNDCIPSTASAVLSWNVASADATNWAVNVNSLTLAGQINIKPWPSDPTRMVVPNTANPVDGGNINNTAGSANHWQAVINDMANYDSAGGGAGPNWHSTAASSAHESAHWTGDYIGDAVTSASGGNWPQTNTNLDALREPKASSATAADARTALSARVNARLATWRSATIRRWNSLISTTDSPGSGGRGYTAGQRVLNTLIASVRAYKTTKGW